MTKSQRNEFDLLVEDIINNHNFKELDNETHHGISRYGHSYRVAEGVYKITKKLHLNYQEATRAALLHDFYFNYQLEENGDVKNLVEHPKMALLNASKYYFNKSSKDLTLEERKIVKLYFDVCMKLYKKGIEKGFNAKL